MRQLKPNYAKSLEDLADLLGKAETLEEQAPLTLAGILSVLSFILYENGGSIETEPEGERLIF